MGVVVFCFMKNCSAQVKHEFHERITEARDTELKLRCQIKMASDIDGGVYGLVILITNESGEKDFEFRVNNELSASYLVTITDSNGLVLSKEPKIFRTDERQTFNEVLIPKKSSHEWLIPLKTQLRESTLRAQTMDACRVNVSVVLAWEPVRILNLYDTNVRLTQESLKGDPVQKYNNRTSK